ncbi:hypothetical protein METP1_03130 [Methanosarcinales archaeon]|nr:hypothetical protein METP1_03130 [Methanosarcinales archaeon]
MIIININLFFPVKVVYNLMIYNLSNLYICMTIPQKYHSVDNVMYGTLRIGTTPIDDGNLDIK